eukprot:15355049-Ditylum_brightwellii.AAC.1
MVRSYFADGYPSQRSMVVETLTGSYQYQAIRSRLGGTLGDPKFGDLDEDDLVLEPRNLFEDDEEVIEPVEPDAINKDPNNYTPETHEEYLGAEVLLPRGGEMHMGTIKRQ